MLRPRTGLRKLDIVVAVVLGVIGGNYVWKPLIQEHLNKNNKLVEVVAESDNSE